MVTTPNENIIIKARYTAILDVMKKDRKQYFELQKKYDNLLSEHNVLKRTYLNLLDGHIDVIDGKNKTIKKLREKLRND